MAVVCAVALGGCECGECAAPTPSAAGVPEWAAAPPIAPVSFFEHACANCHGPHGMFYGEGFAALPDDDALVRAVHEMVIGPARSTLDETSMAALVAYHRHLARPADGPFVVLTRIEGSEVEGEIYPSERVVVIADGREFEAVIDGHVWAAQLGAPARETLIIRAGGADDGSPSIELDARFAAWTHRGPR